MNIIGSAASPSRCHIGLHKESEENVKEIKQENTSNFKASLLYSLDIVI